jgi:hypothetical protein
MPLRTTPTKKPLIPLAQASSPPRADPTPQQQYEAVEPVSRQGIPARPVWVTRGSLQLNREKNSPPQSKCCLDFYLACVALTMPLR